MTGWHKMPIWPALAWVAWMGLSAAAYGQEPLAALRRGGEIVTARWSARPLPVDARAPAWNRAETTRVFLYPQVTANPRNAPRSNLVAEVKALYSKNELALSVEWPDGYAAEQRDIGKFADALALQFPIRYGAGLRLPYVGMGNPASPVGIWFWRADGQVETLAAEGFGSLTAQPSDGVQAKGRREAGTWRVVIRRSLQVPPTRYAVQIQPSRQGLVPISLAIWNGEDNQQDGDKRLSSWHFLHFERGVVDPAYAQSLAWPPEHQGNPEAGRLLLKKTGCANCHFFPGNSLQKGIGPELTYVGGIHRPHYLFESLVNPSAFIVPGKNHFSIQAGEMVSLMPGVSLPVRDIHHLVAYLRTLR